MRVGAVTALAFAALATSAPHAAAGQALGVSPTLVEIPPGKRGSVVQVTNGGKTPVDVQVRPYEWRQVDGTDNLADTAELLVSPSVMTIAPGGKQLLRILAPSATRPRESQWRLLLDQLPGPPGKGLNVRLRMSIPVFAHAAKTDTADVRWTVSDGRLRASNVGGRYARFADLELRRPDGSKAALDLGKTPYLLPGTSRHWPLPLPLQGLQVAGSIGARAFVAPVSLVAAN